jgi:predicted transcriptional regulator of viral defense system/very-short-patch-repair endonuclease
VDLGTSDALDRSVARIAAEHHGVFAIHHLQALAATQAQRTARLQSGRWDSPYEGVYRVAGSPRSWRGDVQAACWAGGTRATASFRSAAELHGLPGRSDRFVEITCPRWRRARHSGLIVHESRALEARDITIVDGLPVTSVERTVFDLAAVCSAVTVGMAIDNALRRELTTVDLLTELLLRLGKRGRKGTRLVRGLLIARIPGYTPTESEQEFMLLTTLRVHGLPDPIRQHTVRDAAGQFVARVDFAYPDLKIALEYDSYQEHVSNRAHVRDSRRRNALLGLGWAVLVATAADVGRGKGAAFTAEVRRARAHRLSTHQPASHKVV